MQPLSQLRASRMFRTSQQNFTSSQDHEMREIRKTNYTADSDDLGQDNDDRYRCLIKRQPLFIDSKELSNLFSPQDYRMQQRKVMLHRMGGISHVLDGLNVWHERGISNESHEERRRRYGINSQNAHFFRQLISTLWSELSNPLVHYLLCFLVFVLLLQYLTQEYPQVHESVAAIVLVFIIVFVRSILARLIETQVYRKLKQSQNNAVEVRRDEQIVTILESDTLVGDILLLKQNDIVMVDGILLKNSTNFIVNQNLTVLNDDKVKKNSAWNESLDSDPFILAGSKVQSGHGEMLVCSVGDNCSLRVVTRLENYRASKTRFLTKLINSLHRFFRMTKTLVMMLLLIELCIQLVRLSPLQWDDIRIIFISVVQSLALLFLVDRQNIPDYLYCYVENNCVSQLFKIVKKETVEDLLGIDVLLIEEKILNPYQEYRARQQCYIYELPNEAIIDELRTVVDTKILTKKTIGQCKSYKLRQVYSVNKYLMSERDIKDLKSCSYVADCKVAGVVESIINTFVVLGYRVGLVTNRHDDLREECVIITTTAADSHLQENSWVCIDKEECQKGLLELFLVSTTMHLMKGAFAIIIINNTLVLGLGYLLLRELHPWHIMLLALLENLVIFYISRHIGCAKMKKVQTISSIKRDVTFFNITTGCFYLYIFVRLQLVHNEFIFLLCNTILRGMYILRYGWYLPRNRWSFVRLHYLLIFAILVANIVVSYYRDKDEYNIPNGRDIGTVREEVMLAVMVGFLQILHLVQRKLSQGLRGLL